MAATRSLAPLSIHTPSTAVSKQVCFCFFGNSQADEKEHLLHYRTRRLQNLSTYAWVSPYQRTDKDVTLKRARNMSSSPIA
ncbi:hypothetical protein HBH71_235880 [Parastagonospora nodorum]|nr:hypothetical protein HBH72_232720 [Parastagonospora nodorum]KAH5099182.1 hypothetical protein HBH71_235880 [Parastagonospora nodorum]